MNRIKDDQIVGIVIPTMNRPEFLVRQIKYYEKVNSPHSVYIVDSSDKANFQKTKELADGLRDRVNVIHKYFPPGPGHLEFIYSLVKEKYICFCGDDDYQVQNTLTKCADFLNNNPDYESVCGRSVTFRLKWNGTYEPYGELDRLSDYPRYALKSDSASERLIGFLGNYYTALVSVSRTETMKKYFFNTTEIKDLSIRDEILQCCLIAVSGKSEVIEELGFVHQIHDQMSYHLPDIFDWIIQKEWLESYEALKKRITAALTEKDKISQDKAELVFKQAFWSYLNKQLPREYGEKYHPLKLKGISSYKKMKAKIGLKFPALKYMYKNLANKIKRDAPRFHYEVRQPGSKYYNDFKPVMDSFTPTPNEQQLLRNY